MAPVRPRNYRPRNYRPRNYRPRNYVHHIPKILQSAPSPSGHHAPSRPLTSHRTVAYTGAHTRAESAPDGAAALVAPRFLGMGFDCSVIVFDRTEVPTLRPVHTGGW